MSSQNLIGRRIQQARKRTKLSQARFGARAGIDPLNAGIRMTRYENGVHVPDFGTAQRLAEVAGVPVAFLYCDDDLLAEMLAAWGSLSEVERIALAAQVRRMMEAD